MYNELIVSEGATFTPLFTQVIKQSLIFEQLDESSVIALFAMNDDWEIAENLIFLCRSFGF
ncbi:hypothetical protein ACYSNW_08830 [Enterococcus sp. LJL99]